MDIRIKDQLFIVGGATSGFGKSIAHALLQEGASIIAIARSEDQLQQLYGNVQAAATVAADITKPETITTLQSIVGNRQIHGIVVNAGGPPAKMVLETTVNDWDDAYQKILRWKVHLVQSFVPAMIKAGYGRLLFIESSSVKQPIENLVLSNSLRLAVVGMVKTLSQEIAATGVTANVMGPGSHNTPAINRLYDKKVEQTGLTFEEVKKNAIEQIPVKALGNPDDFAGLAVWLLSPQSRYVTGQTIAIEGGMVKGVF
jgi:3-oxoacyl-[acyl-carrier protein] reductase